MALEAPMEPNWATQVAGVTAQRLAQHVDLLKRWNPTINLVAPSTLNDVWSRHVLDSTQIFALGGPCRHWADLGTGGGFPGLVVAILAAEASPEMQVTLVEADRRKAEFLRTVSRETGVGVTVIDARIEEVPALGADVVSARALAPLPALCGLSHRHLAAGGCAIFLKGARAGEEVEAARKEWRFDLDSHPSATDPNAAILRLTELRRV